MPIVLPQNSDPPVQLVTSPTIPQHSNFGVTITPQISSRNQITVLPLNDYWNLLYTIASIGSICIHLTIITSILRTYYSHPLLTNCVRQVSINIACDTAGKTLQSQLNKFKHSHTRKQLHDIYYTDKPEDFGLTESSSALEHDVWQDWKASLASSI